MADIFNKYPVTLNGPFTHAFAITPGNTVFSQTTSAIIAGASGNVNVVFADKDNANNTVILNITAGVLYPLRLQSVLANNTTANAIVGLY